MIALSMMQNLGWAMIAFVVSIVFSFIINIDTMGFEDFVIGAFVIFCVLFGGAWLVTSGYVMVNNY